MKYDESSFRGVDRQFCIFGMNEAVRAQILEQIDSAEATLKAAFEEADSFLSYGYIDQEKGISLVVLAPSQRMEEGVAIQQMLEDAGVTVLVEDVREEDFFNIGGTEEAETQLRAQFGPIVEEIDKNYEVSADVQRARGMRFLDGIRDCLHPDDVLVILDKPGNTPETVQVRITEVREHDFAGVLLEEPKQSFGVHKGETMPFALQQKASAEEKEHHTVDDLYAAHFFKLTKAESLNGTVLAKVRDAYKKDPRAETWWELLRVLGSCYVWIPCNATYADAPASDKTINLTADILTNGDKYYFPVFSSPVEMGEDYAADFSLIEKPFREALEMMEGSEAKLDGLIFNAFSDGIILSGEALDIVKGMPVLVED